MRIWVTILAPQFGGLLYIPLINEVKCDFIFSRVSGSRKTTTKLPTRSSKNDYISDKHQKTIKYHKRQHIGIFFTNYKVQNSSKMTEHRIIRILVEQNI